MLIRQPDLPAISHVFTISYVAEKLGEDEEWLWELQIDMFPDGCLRVYGVGEDGVPAFTDYGIEGLKQISPPDHLICANSRYCAAIRRNIVLSSSSSALAARLSFAAAQRK